MKAVINGDELDLHQVLVALDVEQERIDVTPALVVRPDMKWEYVDGAGHWHAFSDDEESPLPTLDKINRLIEQTDPDTEESWSDTISFYVCRECREEIPPRWVEHRPIRREYAPGRLAWRADLRALGAEAQRIRGLDNTTVQFKITMHDTTRFGFGVLQLTGMAGTDDVGSIRLFATIHGTSALGTRKAT